jgi:hypothetical protein
LKDPNLIAAAKQLAPGRLRIGGSQADWICYDTTPGSCAAKIKAKKITGKADSPAFILNMTRWEEIVDFCEATGVQLVFGLNGNTRTPYGNPKSALDFEQNNTRAFVEYVAKNNAKHIFAFELGNELCNKVDPRVYAHDILALRKLVNEFWDATAVKPKVNGPDCNPISGEWVDDFIGNASQVVNGTLVR